MAIVPVPKVLFLCEEYDVEWGMTNLYGLLNSLHADIYPHVQDSFVAFVQLGGGLGRMPLHYDIRRADDGQLIHTSTVRTIEFLNRDQLLQVATVFQGIQFDEPGLYLLELFCDNTWVGDVPLELLGGSYEP